MSKNRCLEIAEELRSLDPPDGITYRETFLKLKMLIDELEHDRVKIGLNYKKCKYIQEQLAELMRLCSLEIN